MDKKMSPLKYYLISIYRKDLKCLEKYAVEIDYSKNSIIDEHDVLYNFKDIDTRHVIEDFLPKALYQILEVIEIKGIKKFDEN